MLNAREEEILPCFPVDRFVILRIGLPRLTACPFKASPASTVNGNTPAGRYFDERVMGNVEVTACMDVLRVDAVACRSSPFLCVQYISAPIASVIVVCTQKKTATVSLR